MSPVALLTTLRGLGAAITVTGDRLRIEGVTLSEEMQAQIKEAKAELVQLLKIECLAPRPWYPPPLDPVTVQEVVGPNASAAEIEMVQHEVGAAIAQLRFEMLEGRVHGWPCLIFGRPLADWLPLDIVAGLLRDFDWTTRGVRRD